MDYLNYFNKYLFNISENKENSNYSGEYRNLHRFILENNLESRFVDKYKEIEPNLNINNWEEYVRGEIDSDELIIGELLGNGYKIFYDDYKDIFVVTKKKLDSVDYEIIKSDDKEVIGVIEDSGVYSDYEPRFAIISNGNIIGGSTYYINEYNIYMFDVGILEEYQGYGMFKGLIDLIISDAKNLETDGIKVEVVNNMLFEYLTKQKGFGSSVTKDVKHAYLDF